MRCNLLKYSHDRAADECVNIGMVFFAPDRTYFIVGDLKRVKKLWAQVDLTFLKQYVNALQKGIQDKRTVDEIINTNYPVSVYFGEDMVLSDNILRDRHSFLKDTEELERDLKTFAAKYLVGLV